MKKKSVINEKPAPPDHLSEKAKKIFCDFVQQNKRAPGQVALLIRGLEAMDTADECERIIRADGLAVKSERSGLARQHPLFNTQKENTAIMLKVWKELHLGKSISNNCFPETSMSDFDFDLEPIDFDI